MTEYVTIWRGNRPTKLRGGIPVVRCRDCLNAIVDKHGVLDCHGPMVQVWDYFNDEPLRNPVPPDGFCAWGVMRIGEPSTETEEPLSKLHRLLDEHGLKWRTHDATAEENCTAFFDGESWHDCWESTDGEINVVFSMTPEQAIEATLERGECHMTKMRLPHDDEGSYWLLCDQCGFMVYMRDWWQPVRFCSHCGAKVVSE